MKKMKKQVRPTNSGKADPGPDALWVKRLLANLEDSFRKALPFFRQYLVNNPQVALKQRLVILEAVETVSRKEPLSCTKRLMTAVISLKLPKMTDLMQPALKAHYTTETYVHRRIALCYGIIAPLIPKAELEAFLESDIMPKMMDSVTSKDIAVRGSVCFTLSHIARAVKAAGVAFTSKEKVLGVLMDFIKDQPRDGSSPSICKQVLYACFFLSQVRPVLRKQQMALVRLSVVEILSLPSKTRSGHSLEKVYSGNARCLLVLLRDILKQDFTPDTLVELLQPLQALCLSPHDLTRFRATAMVTTLLRFYQKESESVQVQGKVPVGRILASLVPRCLEPEPEGIKMALKSIKALMHIWLHGEGRDFFRDSLDNMMRYMDENSSVSCTCADLTQVIGRCLPQLQMETLVQSLIQGVGDCQPSSAHGSCTFLGSLLQAYPTELTGMFAPVIHGFLGLWDADETLRKSMRQVVCQLARMDKVAAINSLISYTSLADSNVQHLRWYSELWEAMAVNSLNPWTLSALVKYLQTAISGGHTVAACAILDNLSKFRPETLRMQFAELFSVLLPLLGPETPAPAAGLSVKIAAVQALKVLLSRKELDQEANQFEQSRAWELIWEEGREAEGIVLLTTALMRFAVLVLPDVVPKLCQQYSTMGKSQKLCVAAFFCALLQKSLSHLLDSSLLAVVIKKILEISEEPLEDIQRLAVQGLKALPKEEILRHALEQLHLLTGALSMWVMDGKPVVLKAISSLVTLLHLCEVGTATKLIPKAYHTAKECLESVNSEIRRATVVLLGVLLKRAFGNKALQKQCHGSLARLLLHLGDSRPAVSQACQLALQQCAPYFSGLNMVMEDHFNRETFIFTAFIREVNSVLQLRYPDTMGVYQNVALRLTKSCHHNIRSCAAVFIGALLEKMEKGFFNFLSRKKLNKGLSDLLKDPFSRVQKAAAEVKTGFHQA
ncbi:maestro heat-like repeat-containing protein family member 1 [Amia ocellicauda]|uniref:maestro heat-like repeat-containing protein family member 1 n=1 Tax=Amia ocellicauda TaxID=2972642 RepID=UPI0034643DA2